MEVDISEHFVQSLLWARAIALERGHMAIQVNDVLLGVLQFTCQSHTELSRLPLDRLLLLKRAIEEGDATSHDEQPRGTQADVPMSADAAALLDRGNAIASDRKHQLCRPSHVLLGATERGGPLSEAFARSGITAGDLGHALGDDTDDSESSPDSTL
ncbi:MAG: Clp protease N-terminal domain-containing protein [Bryobacteraceae bacterium]